MSDIKKPFRITIEQYDQKVSVEVDHSDVSLSEVAELLEQALKGAGFMDLIQIYLDQEPNEALKKASEKYKRKRNL